LKKRQTELLGKVGVALSGGAALGMAHIGALKAMHECDIHPEVISGTSAGALIGAFYAKGIPLEEIEEIAASIDRVKTFQLMSPAIPRGRLVDTKNIEEFFAKYLGKNTRIEDLDMPFVAVTVDFWNGDILYVNQGNLVEAVIASIAIPGVFRPMEANGTLLVDGGLRENLPLRVLREYDPDTIIGVNVLKMKELNFDGYFTGIDRKQKIRGKEPENFVEQITQALRMGRFNRDQNLPRLTYLGYRSAMVRLAEIANKEI